MDDLHLLRELRADLPPIGPQARHAARASLELRFGEARGRAPRARRPRRSRRLRLALAGAALAAVAIAVSIADLGGRADVQPASAAQALRDVSGVAAGRHAEPPPGPGQFFYIRSREAYIASVALPAGPCEKA